MLDGFEVLELLLLLFEGLEDELVLFLFELVFVVEAVLSFFDSEVFDLLDESAYEAQTSARHPYEMVVARVYKIYQKELRKAESMDFNGRKWSCMDNR